MAGSTPLFVSAAALPCARRPRAASCPAKRDALVMRSKRASRKRSNSSGGSGAANGGAVSPGFGAVGADSGTPSSPQGEAAQESPGDLKEDGAPSRPAITRDDRLREELQHPFRRPRLVIFGTLCVSACVGSLFATGRLALGADAPDVFLVNIAVNATAAGLFGWLSRREVAFGRRALGVLARCPEARDLPLGPRLRVGAVKSTPVFVVAGRARDVADVLLRTPPEENDSVVALAVDAGELDAAQLGSGVFAPKLGDDPEDKRAWDAWLAPVKRPRKHVAVFCLDKPSDSRGMGDEYVVLVREASELNLKEVRQEALSPTQ